MGLSGRKVKQRIANDPRNLGWSDDAARFGSAYLSKFGWDSSQGLGAEGDGMKSHLKVSQKLDMLGVGAQHSKDPNGLAWKQNRDFERLLARLNGAEADDATAGTNVDGFSKATEVDDDGLVEAVVDGDEERRARKERRREKRKAKELASAATEEDGEGKKKKKKHEEIIEEVVVGEVVVQAAPVASSSRGPPRGHRAKFIRSKRMALTNSAAMAEVLGISSTASATATEPATPALEPLSLDPEMEKITTSSKSVMDYFKEKLMAKSNHANRDTTPSDVDDEVISRPGLGTSRIAQNAGNHAMPRFGPAAALENSVSELHTKPSTLSEEKPATDESKEARRARKAAKRLAKLADASVAEESTASTPLEESKADRKARRRLERANAEA